MRTDEDIRREFADIMSKAGWDTSRYNELESLLIDEPAGDYKEPRLEKRWKAFLHTQRHLGDGSWGNLTRKLI